LQTIHGALHQEAARLHILLANSLQLLNPLSQLHILLLQRLKQISQHRRRLSLPHNRLFRHRRRLKLFPLQFLLLKLEHQFLIIRKFLRKFIGCLKLGCMICCCFCFSSVLMITTVILANNAIGVPDGPPGQYNMATSFVDQGSIDGLTVGICDGNFKYNVTTSGIIQSDNYPASYNPQTSCTNQFNSTADGITFEFQSFFTEQHFDFIVFRDSDGNDYGGQSCSGHLPGTRISVDSSRLPISIHFNSDDIDQTSGFSIAVSAGYDSSNEIANGPCGNQDFDNYDVYYK